MNELPAEKQCSKCLVFKPMEEFYRDKSHKDGRASLCKCCKNSCERNWRTANPEKWREIQRKNSQLWFAKNTRKKQEYNRKQYAANHEKRREQSRKYREANPEKIRKYRDRNRPTTAQQAIFRAQDPDTLARITKRLAKLKQKQNHE